MCWSWSHFLKYLCENRVVKYGNEGSENWDLRNKNKWSSCSYKLTCCCCFFPCVRYPWYHQECSSLSPTEIEQYHVTQIKKCQMVWHPSSTCIAKCAVIYRNGFFFFIFWGGFVIWIYMYYKTLFGCIIWKLLMLITIMNFCYVQVLFLYINFATFLCLPPSKFFFFFANILFALLLTTN